MSGLQADVQKVIEAQVADGRETGVQVAVYSGGVLVVDAVAGIADPVSGRAVDSGTVFYTWSMGKGMTATIVHRLVARGLFGYDTPISSLWPGFPAGVTVRHALQHTAGLPFFEANVDEVCDWDLICARIAAGEPAWEPGTQTGYHAWTFGFILGELCRRATGTPIGELVHVELADPLGVRGELWFGMPPEARSSLAVMVDAPPPPGAGGFEVPPDSPMGRAIPAALWPTAELGNRPDVLAADIPAGGKMTARAAARMYAALIGPVDGVRLLEPETLEQVLTDRFTGTDQVFGNEATWGLGFAVGAPRPGAFGMAGAGGTYGFALPEAGLAVAYCKNRQTMDFSGLEEVIELIGRSVGA